MFVWPSVQVETPSTMRAPSPKTKRAGQSPGQGDAPSTEQKIIAAAYQCFDRYGIRKTTIDDIASAAGIARPTFYTYFDGKDEIVDHLRKLESLRVNQQIRARMKKHERFADALTECLVITVAVAKENSYVRALIENVAMSPRPPRPTPPATR